MRGDQGEGGREEKSVVRRSREEVDSEEREEDVDRGLLLISPKTVAVKPDRVSSLLADKKAGEPTPRLWKSPSDDVRRSRGRRCGCRGDLGGWLALQRGLDAQARDQLAPATRLIDGDGTYLLLAQTEGCSLACSWSTRKGIAERSSTGRLVGRLRIKTSVSLCKSFS